MVKVYKKMLLLLTAQERKRFYILAALLIAVPIAELFGVSTVLVLLKLYSAPDEILNNPYLAAIYTRLGFTSLFSFQIFVSFAAFLVVLLAQAIKAGGSYAIIRYSAMRGYAISSRLLTAYLSMPYTWFLQQNSADLSKSVLAEVQRVVGNIIIPCLQIFSNALLSLFIITFLIFLDPLISVTAAGLIGGGYLLIYSKLRHHLTRLGEISLDATKKRFRTTNEATGGIKEVKLLGLENHYVNRYRKPALEFARANTLSQLARQMPRFFLEAVTFAILLSIMLIMLTRHNGNLATAIPLLGTFAFAVMRLLPSIQQIYNNVAAIRNGVPVLDHIVEEYEMAMAHRAKVASRKEVTEKVPFRKVMEFRGVSYSYPTANRAALEQVDLKIDAKTTIGVVGGTGAGKTTLVDLMLGLLTPENGQILIDDTPITAENVRAWRNSIGYVPQSIYLTDNSVAENIAFGEEPDKIDMQAVERAAKTASLHDFILSDLPLGYDTVVGERGIRLSGGQRQRIGIARALYRDPELLILDEATSALDNLTERAVMEAVQNIGHDKTVIMIAHRLSTVKPCDLIFLMENGRVGAVGSYDTLIETNENFRNLASAG